LNATATVQSCAQIGNGWSWSRQATPENLLEQRELDFSRSITEPLSGHSQHQIALRWTKPEPFGNGNPGVSACSNEGIPACDNESSKERMKTPDCLSPWHQHHTGFDDFNLAAGISNSLFASETFVGSVVPGTGNHHSNLVDNMRSQPYQEGSCDNSAHEWDGLGMDKLSRFCAHEPNNLHQSNEGSGSGSVALCNSKYEAVVVHEPAASMHNDLWGPEITTVMIRRIPRRYTQQMLVAEVANRGFDGFFDFLYLPWERKQDTNTGYAFMNFVEAKGAMEFKESFDGLYLNNEMEMRSRPLRVHPAAVQGYQAIMGTSWAPRSARSRIPAIVQSFWTITPWKRNRWCHHLWE